MAGVRAGARGGARAWWVQGRGGAVPGHQRRKSETDMSGQKLWPEVRAGAGARARAGAGAQLSLGRGWGHEH